MRKSSTPNRKNQTKELSQHQREMKAIQKEAEDLLKDPTLLDRIAADIGLLGVAGEKSLTTTIYLTGTSRLLTDPLSARTHGESSSGKSYVIDRVADLFPPEDVIRATHMTNQALYYMEPGRLQHKFVVFGERSRLQTPEAEEASKAWRELVESGKLDKWVTVSSKDTDAGFETQHIHQDGPIASIESTTLSRSEILNEDVTRCIFLWTDESSLQTRAVYRRMAESSEGNGRNVNRIIEVHRHAQRILRGLGITKVKIPFLKSLAEQFPTSQVQGRRVFKQVKAAIEASALLHAFQRKTLNKGKTVIAEARDYEIVVDLIGKHVSAALCDIDLNAAKKFYHDFLRFHYCVGATFTSTQLMMRAEGGHTKRNVYRYLESLRNAHWIKDVGGGEGNDPVIYEMLKEVHIGTSGGVLPVLKDVTERQKAKTPKKIRKSA